MADHEQKIYPATKDEAKGIVSVFLQEPVDGILRETPQYQLAADGLVLLDVTEDGRVIGLSVLDVPATVDPKFIKDELLRQNAPDEGADAPGPEPEDAVDEEPVEA